METARRLAEVSRGRPAQANLRRAVSTACYALFHCLARAAANLFAGKRKDAAWHRVYRALEHGRARSACRDGQAMQVFPEEVRDFAKAFVVLQEDRQRADYALDGSLFYKSDVVMAIDTAESAIGRFEQADADARRNFAAHVLFRQRP